MRNIITGGFTGRLGNQCFQIASVIGLAIKYGAEYTFQRPTDHDVWKVYFDHFPEIDLNGMERQYYNESVNEYTEIPYNGGLLCLCGYFQSYKYFGHCREEIIKAFNFNWSPIPKVSIHVRRTDYVAGTPFEPITMDYISNAIKYFTFYGYKNFLVFSDDIEWCKQNITTGTFYDCSFEYSEGKSAIDDLSLMSSCTHQIIANSTFSWWAAWLNQNPNKIIVCPPLERWFNGVNKDLLPDEWIKI